MSRKKIFWGLLWILWMTVIFYFSSQDGSASGKLSEGILYIMGMPVYPPWDFLIRKMAHMSEYALLAALTYFFFVSVGIRQPITYAFLFTFVYSVSDEVHQLFVPGRSGRVFDVCVDMLGAMILFIVLYGIKRMKHQPTPVDK